MTASLFIVEITMDKIFKLIFGLIFLFNYNLFAHGKNNREALLKVNSKKYIKGELNAHKYVELHEVEFPSTHRYRNTNQFNFASYTTTESINANIGGEINADSFVVPVYNDSELLNSLKYLPVPADEIKSTSSKEIKQKSQSVNNKDLFSYKTCNLSSLPVIQFRSSFKFSKETKSLLKFVAAQLRANTNCNVKVIGHYAISESSYQLAWYKVNAICRYLIEHESISECRLIFDIDLRDNIQLVDLEPTTDSGPSSIPNPHFHLKSIN